jgi:hypothetical protein
MTSFLSALPIPSRLKRNTVRRTTKTPEQLVDCSKEAIDRLIELAITETGSNQADVDPLETVLGDCLADLKVIMHGDISNNKDLIDQIDENIVRDICTFVLRERLMSLLIRRIDLVPFEARKDTALIFNSLLRNYTDFEDYMVLDITLINSLVQGYSLKECALTCGSMLRECIRHDRLVRYILCMTPPQQSTPPAPTTMTDEPSGKAPSPSTGGDRRRETSDPSSSSAGVRSTEAPPSPPVPLLCKLFDEYVELIDFEVSSDAFNTLKDLLTTPKNKAISAEFLEKNFDLVFDRYNKLLLSDNYVTKRRSISLLSELLLERCNYNVMMRHISSKENLKTIMNLLRHKSSNVQLETFQIFKIFVANPKKTEEIASILYHNKVKLVAYLEGFHLDKTEPQFVDEKRLLIDTLQGLSDPNQP